MRGDALSPARRAILIYARLILLARMQLGAGRRHGAVAFADERDLLVFMYVFILYGWRQSLLYASPSLLANCLEFHHHELPRRPPSHGTIFQSRLVLSRRSCAIYFGFRLDGE